MPARHDAASIRELTHFDVRATVAEELDSLRPGRRMTRAVHDEIRTEAADDIPHARDAFRRGRELADVNGRLGAELARQPEPWLLRRADRDHSSCSHFLGRGDGEDADRTGPL